MNLYKDIVLTPLGPDHGAAIANWPDYPQEFAELNYALREHGWLRDFSCNPAAQCFVVMEAESPVAFSILANTAADEAEFRMALRADKLGKGLGKRIAAATLAHGFERTCLSRIHLVVRKKNHRAIALYKKLGFHIQGDCVKTFDGQPADFFMMEITR